MYALSTKMTEVLMDRSILMLLSSLQFPLGFGDASIEDVCIHNAYPARVFLMLANVCSDESYRPDLTTLTSEDATALVEYVRRSHKYFSEGELPHLHSLIHGMLVSEDAVFADVLNKYFDDLLQNVNAHFEEEEQALDSGSLRVPGEEEAHYDFIEKLDDLKNLVVKYLPDTGDSTGRYLMLMNLLDLENCLRGHILIEEKILLPLEEKLGHTSSISGQHQEEQASDSLSQREKEIVSAVAHGKTNKEIADALFISINTVVTHRKNISRKTGINSIAGLTVYAILNGIVTLDELNKDKI